MGIKTRNNEFTCESLQMLGLPQSPCARIVQCVADQRQGSMQTTVSESAEGDGDARRTNRVSITQSALVKRRREFRMQICMQDLQWQFRHAGAALNARAPPYPALNLHECNQADIPSSAVAFSLGDTLCPLIAAPSIAWDCCPLQASSSLVVRIPAVPGKQVNRPKAGYSRAVCRPVAYPAAVVAGRPATRACDHPHWSLSTEGSSRPSAHYAVGKVMSGLATIEAQPHS